MGPGGGNPQHCHDRVSVDISVVSIAPMALGGQTVGRTFLITVGIRLIEKDPNPFSEAKAEIVVFNHQSLKIFFGWRHFTGICSGKIFQIYSRAQSCFLGLRPDIYRSQIRVQSIHCDQINGESRQKNGQCTCPEEPERLMARFNLLKAHFISRFNLIPSIDSLSPVPGS